MGPRLLSMVFIQLVYMARDNLASRLGTGAVTSLTYGWLIMQVPETLLGTAIATALLPTLSEFVVKEAWVEIKRIITRATQVMIALALPICAILSLGLLPIIQLAFGFEQADAQMVLWASQAYLIGVLGHSLVELGVRSFYARQSARIPVIGSAFTLVIYIALAVGLMQVLGASGIALANSISYTILAIFLYVVLNRSLPGKIVLGPSFLRSLLAAILGGSTVWLTTNMLPIQLAPVFLSIIGMSIGVIVAAFVIRKELKLLLHL